MAIRLPPLDDREIVDARDMSLSAWLNLVLDARKRHRILIIDYEFPSEDHKREYLASVKSRSEEDIKKLLRLFLLDSGVLGHDSLNVQSLGVIVRDGDSLRRVLGNEYDRRLITYALGIRKGITRPPPWEGNTWALDLLPHWPRQAIEAINGYVLAHAQQLPDGRYNGLLEAAAVIRARYIEPTGDLTRERAAIFSLTPREFEHLVERLYAAMGYETGSTPRFGECASVVSRRVDLAM
jgi:restriction system protein